MLKKEIAQVEHWFHTEAERFMLRHQGLGILLIFMGMPLAALILVALGAGARCPAGGMAVRRTVTGHTGTRTKPPVAFYRSLGIIADSGAETVRRAIANALLSICPSLRDLRRRM